MKIFRSLQAIQGFRRELSCLDQHKAQDESGPPAASIEAYRSPGREFRGIQLPDEAVGYREICEQGRVVGIESRGLLEVADRALRFVRKQMESEIVSCGNVLRIDPDRVPQVSDRFLLPAEGIRSFGFAHLPLRGGGDAMLELLQCDGVGVATPILCLSTERRARQKDGSRSLTTEEGLRQGN